MAAMFDYTYLRGKSIPSATPPHQIFTGKPTAHLERILLNQCLRSFTHLAQRDRVGITTSTAPSHRGERNSCRKDNFFIQRINRKHEGVELCLRLRDSSLTTLTDNRHFGSDLSRRPCERDHGSREVPGLARQCLIGQYATIGLSASNFCQQTMPASFKDISDAFDFVDIGGSLGEHRAFLCRRTGKIYCRSEFYDMAELNDELPDDIEDDGKYIAIPDKRELLLGKPLALDFSREVLPNDFNEVRYIFGKRGAYRKFRALLVRRNAVDRWYEFESKATEQALRSWCELNSIIVLD